MLTSIATAEISSALSAAQAALKNPARSKTVTVTAKSGARYTFKYAPLEAIIDSIREPMAKNGLSIVQAMGQGIEGVPQQLTLTTRLCHRSGEWMESSLPIYTDAAGPQALGSAITYVRRYALTALLNIATDDDDDGNGAEGNHVEPVAKATPVAKPAQAEAKTRRGVEDFAKAIQLATTTLALNRLAKEIATELKTAEERDDIRPTFQKRLTELTTAGGVR